MRWNWWHLLLTGQRVVPRLAGNVFPVHGACQFFLYRDEFILYREKQELECIDAAQSRCVNFIARTMPQTADTTPGTVLHASVSAMPAGKRVGSTANTMKVLAFVAQEGSATMTQIVKATSINTSTCFNIARTLAAEGYLKWIAETKRYHIGPALAALAHHLTARKRGLESLLPAMQRVANDYALTVTLWRRHSLRSMALEMVAETDSALRIRMPIGQHLPVLLGGMGRIMALRGGLSDEQRLSIFRTIQWGRPLPYGTFMEQAKLAQRQGYGVDEGYTHRSVTAVAAAVPNSKDVVEEVVSATMFLDQHRPAVLRRLVLDLRQLAREATEI